jgi:hypothetical protein
MFSVLRCVIKHLKALFVRAFRKRLRELFDVRVREEATGAVAHQPEAAGPVKPLAGVPSSSAGGWVAPIDPISPAPPASPPKKPLPALPAPTLPAFGSTHVGLNGQCRRRSN